MADRRAVRPPLALLVLLAAAGAARAAEVAEVDDRAAHIRSHYTKLEHRVPMRDGTRLFTTVYAPKDRARPYPILLYRTPYSVGPYGPDRYRGRLGPTAAYEREGFIFVLQDVRGKFMSEGEFANVRPHVSDDGFNEATDTRDTIDWLLANVENHNGRVGMWGISYPGFYAAAGAIDGHPALRAVSPQAPIADWYWDDMHHHGALILPLTFSFFYSFGQPRAGPTTEWSPRFDFPTPDGYRFFLELGPLRNVNDRHFHGEVEFWNQVVAHPDYDEFWQARNLLPHLHGIDAAVLVVGGWYDTEDLYGPLQIYRAIERNNPGADNRLVMGPWTHGGWTRTDGDRLGPIEFGYKTSPEYQETVELPFFVHHLKDGPAPDLPEALAFETGANRWRRFDAWPPRDLAERRLYFRADGGLSFEAPPSAASAFDAYVSDPARPVPHTMEITTGWTKTYMTEDQRFA
ncbi:MAG: CocE/NonD family hydrolase, partial [Planctomycetota bacterium]